MIANVRDYGARGDGKTDDTAAILEAAKAASPGVLFLPPGRYMTTGIKLADMSCGITGSGDCTSFEAIGPQQESVLDFTGYRSPPGFYDLRVIERFRVLGDNRPNPASKGIVLGSDDETKPPLTGMCFRDLSVRSTGGTCLDLAHSTCCHFERITLNCPVAAGTNDTPWICARGPFNGNTLSSIGFRSDGPPPLPADAGRSGAARFLESAASHFAPEQNIFRDWWFEYQHMSEGSCLFALQGSGNLIDGFRYFDTIRMPGATGTAAIRLLQPSPGKVNYGGNTVRCQLTGVNTPVHSPGIGVEVFQAANSIEGAKLAGGANVVLHPTALYSSVEIRGGHPDPKGRPSVVGPDGRPTTVDGTATIHDPIAGYHHFGGGEAGATVEFGGGRKWTTQGLFLNDDQY